MSNEAEIERLKAEARDLAQIIKEKALSGDFELSQAAKASILSAANNELAVRPIDEILKGHGVNRRARRKLAHDRKRGEWKMPEHQRRAQAIADKRAAERVKNG